MSLFRSYLKRRERMINKRGEKYEEHKLCDAYRCVCTVVHMVSSSPKAWAGGFFVSTTTAPRAKIKQCESGCDYHEFRVNPNDFSSLISSLSRILQHPTNPTIHATRSRSPSIAHTIPPSSSRPLSSSLRHHPSHPHRLSTSRPNALGPASTTTCCR